jgi:predicted dinucleotide-binding enzyme
MKIGILGTGIVSQTLAAKLSAGGQAVMIGTRDVAATMARSEPDAMGNPPFRVWRDHHPHIAVGSLPVAAGHGDLVINALAGAATIEGLRRAGADHFAGKILLDLSNPLDFSHGFPPSLFVSSTDSLGERVQRELPAARVVKTLHTVNASVMVEPRRLAGGDHTMFVCGNDPSAKGEVTRMLVEWFGWSDVIDLGDITNARATEALLLLWTRTYASIKSPMFSFKVVR